MIGGGAVSHGDKSNGFQTGDVTWYFLRCIAMVFGARDEVEDG